MSVPDNETFSLQHIIDEIPESQYSLQDCFNTSLSIGFDDRYNKDAYAPPNSMLRFRNYIRGIGIQVSGSFTSRTPTQITIHTGVTVTKSSNIDLTFLSTLTNCDGRGSSIEIAVTVPANELSSAGYFTYNVTNALTTEYTAVLRQSTGYSSPYFVLNEMHGIIIEAL